jgi:hypothetical protein
MKSIIIKLVNGKKYIFDINEDAIYKTVKTLKYSIEESLDIKVAIQRLLYHGSPLSNDFMLINLPDNCIINLILQLETISE